MQEFQQKKTVKKGRDLLLILITAVLAGIGTIMPACLLVFVLIELGLAEGERIRLGAVLLVVFAFVQYLITRSLLLTAAVLLMLLIVMGTVYIWRRSFMRFGHFNGVLVSCFAVALALAAAYGIFYLALGGDPVHIISTQIQDSIVQNRTEAGTELLRLFWQTHQVMLLTQTGSFTPQDAAAIIERSATLTHAQMAAQVDGALESLMRMVLPALYVLYTALGGLVTYVFSAQIRAFPKGKFGRFLQMQSEEKRGLAPFEDWALPRDVGLALFGAVIVLLLLSFIGIQALDTATNLVYTLFNIVFYVQGLATFYFLTKRWKWPKAVRIIATAAVGIIAMGIVPTLGIVDYILHLRTLIKLSGKMKVVTFSWPKEADGQQTPSQQEKEQIPVEDDPQPEEELPEQVPDEDHKEDNEQ